MTESFQHIEVKDQATITKNLKFLRNSRGYSVQKMADALGGIHRATYYSWEIGGAQPNIQMLLKIAHEFDVSVDQLLRVDFKNESKKKSNDLTGETHEVELVPYKAAAGYSASYSDRDWLEENIKTIRIPFKPPHGDVRAFPIIGDSMEPKVSDGSFVIGVRLRDPKREVEEGKDYLIVTRDNGIMYKIFFKINDNAELRSLNYKKHPPIRIQGEDILQVWKYFCALDIGKL